MILKEKWEKRTGIFRSIMFALFGTRRFARVCVPARTFPWHSSYVSRVCDVNKLCFIFESSF